MAPKSKGKQKSSFNSSFISKKPRSITPPAPFTRPSKTLQPFLDELSIKHAYITSIDTLPWQFKAKIFAIPVLTNILLILGILYRIYVMVPYYMQIASGAIGQSTDNDMLRASSSVNSTAYEIGKRMVSFFIDYCIYAFVLPFPREFFFGTSEKGSPLAWRSHVGFQDKEIIVRRSKKWDESIGDVARPEAPGRRLFEEQVTKATSLKTMHDRTGYLLINSAWDLDWLAMVLAHQFIAAKEPVLNLQDFRTTVYVHSEEFGWLAYSDASTSGSEQESRSRQKLISFKDELTGMGKESLFFRWIEIIQYESEQPGGFTEERQLEAMRKAKELFEINGIDFDKFWEKVGGMEGMPGLELARRGEHL
jgi:hypothetical protein